MRRAALAIAVGLACGQAGATAVDAIDCPASDGAYAIFSDVGQVRTQIGNDYGYGLFVNVDDFTQADAVIWSWKRQSNDADNWTIIWKDNIDGFCLDYQFSDVLCINGGSEDTWEYLGVTYDEPTDTFTMYLFTNGGTLIDSDTFTTTTSNSDDGQVQDTALCGEEIAGVIAGEFNGLVALPWKVYGAEPSQADHDNYATDPLNIQNTWDTSTFTTALHFAFDAGVGGGNPVDMSGNGETLTPQGAAAWGALNGPDVPVETGGGSVLMMSRFREGR